jgi:hypothetical protein
MKEIDDTPLTKTESEQIQQTLERLDIMMDNIEMRLFQLERINAAKQEEEIVRMFERELCDKDMEGRIAELEAKKREINPDNLDPEWF